MPVQYHPKPGQILMCDFSGLQPPEMVKKRPVVIFTPELAGRAKLVTVVPLSSTRPDPIRPYHLQLPNRELPQLGWFQENETWLKGDMLYTVALRRLDLVRLGKRDPETGKRRYFQRRLGQELRREIEVCVLNGLGLGHLVPPPERH
ncbi:MAG: type II toxin-antitoxin system PemK/MazF family toxin [Halorhodospira sp.]